MLREEIGEAFVARLITGQKPLALNLDIPLLKKTAKVVDGHMVNVGRVIPTVWKLLRHWHPPAKHMGKTDAPLPEIGEGYKGLPPDAHEVVKHEIWPFGCLQCLAENGVVKAAIWVIGQIDIGVALNYR